jgi:hypothetical protein
LILKLRSHKTTLLVLLAPSSTLQNLKEEVAPALNDTAETPRDVSPDDITIYKRKDGQWTRLDQEEKGGKRTREATLEELDIRGVGAGSTVDEDGEVLGYTVKNGLEEEQTMEVEAYPRED